MSTKSIGAASEEEKAQLGIDSSVLTDVKVQGVSAFSIDDTLRLEIEGSPEPIIVKPKSETIFGRRDPATGAMPDVDLTPFAGYRMGVSRRHAAIRQGEEQSLNIWDLGSSNGTYLNGQKLTAHRPYRLHDGDELRLGQMMVRIRFQLGSEEPVVAVTETIGDQLDDVPPVVVKPEVAPPAVAKPADEKPPITDELPQAASKVASQAAASPATKPATKPEINTETTTEAKTEAKTDAGTKPESSAQPANAKDPDSDQKP
ncbi:MAG: FHA domain-containing protein, partial [Anaerolineae bacterium]|nr:FHA domain-containing protein [Anaerolineae bacterium]